MERNSGLNSTELALKIVVFSVFAGLAIVLLYKIKVLLVCVFIALTLASAIAPVAEMAERKKIPRLVTVLALSVAALAIYGWLAAALVPTIREQWVKLLDNLPSYLTKLNIWFQNVLNLPVSPVETLAPSGDNLGDLSLGVIKRTLDMTAGLVGLFVNSLLVWFLTACFVVEANQIWATILKWLPSSSRPTCSRLIAPLSLRMGGYVRGQALVALSVGIILFTGFSVLGIKYALLLGILAGGLNVVPYVGSLIAVACAVIVAFNQTPVLAGAVLILYAVEQWTESTILVPFFLGQNVFLHPLVVLLAILVGASLMGVPGALIAVPLASVSVYLAEEFYLKRSNMIDVASSPAQDKAIVEEKEST